jgi:nucleoside-diphosphate-sugar epimerase
MYKIALTGAHGFIGNHLKNKLENDRHKAIAIPHELLYKEGLYEFLKNNNPDIIIHLAAYGNMAFQKEEAKIFDANIIGTWNLLQASKSIPYKAFINISSSSVLLPHETFYSATKAAAERLCNAFIHEHNKPIITARLFSVYGIGEAYHRFIPTVFRSCIQEEPMRLSPDALHDWIYIDDVVNCLILAMDWKHKYIDCGSGIKTSNYEILKMIEKITGKRANIIEKKQMRSFDTIAWPASSFNFSTISLKEGLQLIYQDIKIKQDKGVI